MTTGSGDGDIVVIPLPMLALRTQVEALEAWRKNPPPSSAVELITQYKQSAAERGLIRGASPFARYDSTIPRTIVLPYSGNLQTFPCMFYTSAAASQYCAEFMATVAPQTRVVQYALQLPYGDRRVAYPIARLYISPNNPPYLLIGVMPDQLEPIMERLAPIALADARNLGPIPPLSEERRAAYRWSDTVATEPLKSAVDPVTERHFPGLGDVQSVYEFTRYITGGNFTSSEPTAAIAAMHWVYTKQIAVGDENSTGNALIAEAVKRMLSTHDVYLNRINAVDSTFMLHVVRRDVQQVLTRGDKPIEYSGFIWRGQVVANTRRLDKLLDISLAHQCTSLRQLLADMPGHHPHIQNYWAACTGEGAEAIGNYLVKGKLVDAIEVGDGTMARFNYNSMFEEHSMLVQRGAAEQSRITFAAIERELTNMYNMLKEETWLVK